MTMHRLQPAIDVTPLEEDVALIEAAPALLETIEDFITRYRVAGDAYCWFCPKKRTTHHAQHCISMKAVEVFALAEGKEATDA